MRRPSLSLIVLLIGSLGCKRTERAMLERAEVLVQEADAKARNARLADPALSCKRVVFPKAESYVMPYFPEAVRRSGVQGGAKIVVKVSEGGSVVETQILEQTAPLIGQAADRAVRNWRYTPCTCDGRPVAAFVTEEFTVPAQPGN